MSVGDRAAARMGTLQGNESALRLDEGLFFSSLQDDYCLPVPSHGPELERLNICHEIYQYTAGSLPQEVADHLADDDDDEEVKTVLDVGSGTGIWAAEIAREYPHVEVTGVDLVNCPLADPPDNVTFLVRDVLYGFEDEDDTYDVVHVRDIALGMRDYPAMLAECVRVLKPGGYLVVQEMEWLVDYLDESLSAEERCPTMYNYMLTLHTAIQERSLDPLVGYNLDYYVPQVHGLAETSFERYCVPVSPGSDDPTDHYLGTLSAQTWALFAQAARLLLKDHGGYDSQELGEGGMAELEGEDLYWFFDVCVARKAG